MKQIFFLSLLLFNNLIVSGQINCDEALKQSKIEVNSYSELVNNIEEYYKVFKSNVENTENKLNLGVTIPFEGVPIPIDLSNSSKTDKENIEESLKKSSYYNQIINSKSIKFTFIPDNQTKAWIECLKINSDVRASITSSSLLTTFTKTGSILFGKVELANVKIPSQKLSSLRLDYYDKNNVRIKSEDLFKSIKSSTITASSPIQFNVNANFNFCKVFLTIISDDNLVVIKEIGGNVCSSLPVNSCIDTIFVPVSKQTYHTGETITLCNLTKLCPNSTYKMIFSINLKNATGGASFGVNLLTYVNLTEYDNFDDHHKITPWNNDADNIYKIPYIPKYGSAVNGEFKTGNNGVLDLLIKINDTKNDGSSPTSPIDIRVENGFLKLIRIN